MTSTNLRESLDAAAACLRQFRDDAAAVAAAQDCGEAIAARLKAGGKILICGNGGSLCDAAHFAEELTGRFRSDRRPWPAIACADAGHITCTANDYGFDEVFARWVTALARPGDVVILLSTSGNSANIRRAADAAKATGAESIALLGRGGGKMLGRCDREVIAPGETSDRIQELHMLILHGWVEIIEARLAR